MTSLKSEPESDETPNDPSVKRKGVSIADLNDVRSVLKICFFLFFKLPELFTLIRLIVMMYVWAWSGRLISRWSSLSLQCCS